jgi:hypothetical protein
MSAERHGRPWVVGPVVAAALTASSVAHADVPDATWGALRNREVILETQGGKRIGGKLIDVHPTSVALLLPSGDSLMIDRGNVRSARAAGDEALPSYKPGQPQALSWQEAPRVRRWKEGDAIPPGYYPGTERRLDLIIGGSVTFGAAWLPTALMGTFVAPALAIPVAGPLLMIRPVEGGLSSGLEILLVIDGIQQAAGITMLIVGLAAPRKVLFRFDVQAPKIWWMPAPISFGKGSVGLGIVGTM